MRVKPRSGWSVKHSVESGRHSWGLLTPTADLFEHDWRDVTGRSGQPLKNQEELGTLPYFHKKDKMIKKEMGSVPN